MMGVVTLLPVVASNPPPKSILEDLEVFDLEPISI